MPSTRAQLNRKVRQEALRDQLEAQGHVQHITDILDKVSNLSIELDHLAVQRLKVTIDTKLKLIGKYLPDLKQQEIELTARHTISEISDEELQNIVENE